MILVVGSPNSGKSSLAENLICQLCENNKAYIATMEPFGEEGKKRVEKHRLFREGKGFETFEQYRNVSSLKGVLAENNLHGALLECVSNLVGNELEEAKEFMSEEQLAVSICEDILALDEVLKSFVVVTNEFEELPEYDDKTKKYIRLTKLVNIKLMKMAECFYIKEEGQWNKYENN